MFFVDSLTPLVIVEAHDSKDLCLFDSLEFSVLKTVSGTKQTLNKNSQHE